MNETRHPLSDLRTRRETAERLRVTERTLDSWVKQEIGPAPTRIGGRVFFREAAIDDFLARRTELRPEEKMSATIDPRPAEFLDEIGALTAIIESELTQRCEGHPGSAHLIAFVSSAAAVLRVVDKRIRARDLAAEDFAARHVKLINTLARGLCRLGQPCGPPTLAEDVLAGACTTAQLMFPLLLPGE